MGILDNPVRFGSLSAISLRSVRQLLGKVNSKAENFNSQLRVDCQEMRKIVDHICKIVLVDIKIYTTLYLFVVSCEPSDAIENHPHTQPQYGWRRHRHASENDTGPPQLHLEHTI